MVADDPKYLEFQGVLKKIILTITNEWDKLRIKHKEDGDAENTENMSKKQRKSSELFNAVAQEYSSDGSNQKEDAEK